MRHRLAAALWTACVAMALASAAHAASAPAQQLTLIAERPVEGMAGGNLSGLARCAGTLQAISDRDDQQIYRLQTGEGSWRAEAEPFQAPEVPDTGMAWGHRVRVQVASLARGGELDFEDLTCDLAGNRYLVSEAHAAVLKLDPLGRSEWLGLPSMLLRQARASGMLLKLNALYEGLAIDPQGQRLWLAAERERRGLLVVHQQGSRWQCSGGCVLVSDNQPLPSPAQPEVGIPPAFTSLVWFKGKLFTLESSSNEICRREPSTGQLERCWSFASVAGEPALRYDTPYGVAEALWIDESGAYVGVDNNGEARADGEARPVIWQLAVPSGGWSAP